MSSAIRWVTAIRDIGVSGQDFTTIRRLRMINLAALLAVLDSLGYCTLYAVYDWVHFRTEISVLIVVSAFYPIVFLLSAWRRPGAAMWWLVGVTLTYVGVINWLVGPASAGLSFLLITPIVASLMISGDDRLSVWPIALAASTIFTVVTFWGGEGSVGSMSETFRVSLFLSNVFGAVLVASGIGLFFRAQIQRAEAKLGLERERSDRLLRAILPDPIAEQLKADESGIIAERFADATVLFADIVGFTKRSAEIDAGILVTELNGIFRRIDELAETRGVEKIKTIGDAYFAVCGVPKPVRDHTERIADFALDLRAAAEAWHSTVWPELQFRIVIHVGPVVAGVIGRTKFAYDVWGDTINTAARLEEHCSPGEILISDKAAAALPPRFAIESLGTIDVRDKGEFVAHRLVTRGPH